MTALREKHNMQHNSKAVNIIINVEVKEFHPVRTAAIILSEKIKEVEEHDGLDND